MQLNTKRRLEALEALEAQQEAASGRRLQVYLYIRPIDYFTLFEAEPADGEAIARIEQEYRLDCIDWEHDRVLINGGTWPNVPVAREHTIEWVKLPDGYGCRIDNAPWVDREPGAPFWCIAEDGAAMAAVRRAHRETLCAGFDLVLNALDEGRAEWRPLSYGNAPGQAYGPLSYGVCMISDPEIIRWSNLAHRLMYAAGARPSTIAEYRDWIETYRQGGNNESHTTDAPASA